jgi:hypothetical protein
LEPEEKKKNDYQLWKHYARIKRLSIESSKKTFKANPESEVSNEILKLEIKRNHYFDIEAQID